MDAIFRKPDLNETFHSDRDAFFAVVNQACIFPRANGKDFDFSIPEDAIRRPQIAEYLIGQANAIGKNGGTVFLNADAPRTKPTGWPEDYD